MTRLFVLCAVVAGSAWAAEPTFEIEGGRLVLPGPIAFETGAATLARDAEPALAHVQAYLAAKIAVTTLRVEGHVAAGTTGAQALSEARALAVARWLVAHGVDCKRLLPVGFGDTKPVAANDTPEGRAQNARIEARNAALLGRAIGGLPLDGGGQVAGDPCR